MNLAKRWPDFLLPLGIIACLMVIFVPLPPSMMDFLLAANISVAVVVLLGTVYVKSPLEFSVFPTVLLATTLARLALNIGTTRLILTRGAIDGDLAAGGVIQGFSNFVTGNNLAVGIVIFSIIVVIQFVVITKGATRISEVAARFALDGLPGRQMAIDAELSAGTIDEHQARQRREETLASADFYGAMDGASKFVRGDAIAGVIITMINVIAGLVIGISSQMSVGEAAQTFTKLTIGDGLVSQLPALMISLAAGLLVTRSARHTDLPRESLRQVFARPVVLVLTAMFLGMLVFTELPKTPLLLIGTGMLIAAWWLSSQQSHSTAVVETQADSKNQVAPTESTLDRLLSQDMMEMELGVGLIRLADARQGGDLLARITQVRVQIASELGVVLPKIRIRDNLNLGVDKFQILIHGSVAQRGEIRNDAVLAIDRGYATGPIDDGAVVGVLGQGMLDSPAFWIDPSTSLSVQQSGYEINSPTEVLADQLKLTAASNASQILTRDATKQLIDEVEKTSPAVVSELIPDLMSLGQVQQVLKSLIEEGVSIRPLGLILEALGDHAATVSNRWDLVEKVRLRLGRHLSTMVKNAQDTIHVCTIAQELQDRIASAWERNHDEIRIDLPRELLESLALAMEQAAGKMATSGLQPVLLVDQTIRPVIAELAYELSSDLFVLGSREIVGASIQPIDEISGDCIKTAAA